MGPICRDITARRIPKSALKAIQKISKDILKHYKGYFNRQMSVD
jgi:hypothetical protein